ARDGKLIATVALALIVFPEAVFAVIGAPAGPEASGVSLISYFIVILLGCVAQIAINRLAIGPGVTVGSAIARIPAATLRCRRGDFDSLRGARHCDRASADPEPYASDGGTG